jgi:hypothetical protein
MIVGKEALKSPSLEFFCDLFLHASINNIGEFTLSVVNIPVGSLPVKSLPVKTLFTIVFIEKFPKISIFCSEFFFQNFY